MATVAEDKVPVKRRRRRKAKKAVHQRRSMKTKGRRAPNTRQFISRLERIDAQVRKLNAQKRELMRGGVSD